MLVHTAQHKVELYIFSGRHSHVRAIPLMCLVVAVRRPTKGNGGVRHQRSVFFAIFLFLNAVAIEWLWRRHIRAGDEQSRTQHRGRRANRVTTRGRKSCPKRCLEHRQQGYAECIENLFILAMVKRYPYHNHICFVSYTNRKSSLARKWQQTKKTIAIYWF